jgi:hypothetical protein
VVGQQGQCHDDAPKEETAPAGVAIVNFKQGFLPGTSVSPKNRRKKADFSHPWPHHRREESRTSLPTKGMR